MDPRTIEQIGPYRVRRFVAEGGMAWVFEVVDPKFAGRRLALKMLKPEAAIGEEFERFKSEAELLTQIDHPNLVTVFDAGRDEATGWLYYTMTFVDGGTLASLLAERSALPLDEVGHVVLNLLDGLAALHRNSIIHRDVKPQNLMIGSDGRVRLADLGIARRARSSRHTRTGYAVGTVAYMAPEQARGNRELTPASDVFSAGLTLYETLTGRSVYEGVTGVDSSSSNEVLGYLVALARTGEEIEITYPPEVDLPSAVRKVIERACRLDPKKRFPDADAMRLALAQAMAETQAPPGPWRRRALLAAGASALATALAIGWWLLVQKDPSRLAQEMLELAGARRGEASALLERAKDLSPPPPKALIQSVDRKFERAEDRLSDARADATARSHEAARSNAERALSGFDSVCGELTGGGLADRARTAVDASSKEVATLGGVAASDELKQEWKNLDEAQKALVGIPSGAPCEVARAHLDRIDQAANLREDSRKLEQRLKELWPRMAEKARGEARKAEELARAEKSDAAEYGAALKQGEAAHSLGRKKEAAKDYAGARASYQAAEEHFELAALVGPAARARAKVRRLEEGQTAKPPVEVSRKVARCDSDWRDGKWGGAATSCEEAADAMSRAARQGEREKGLELARTDARARQDAARVEGAEHAAGPIWDRGVAELAKGEEARRAGDHDLAQQAFEAAAARFTEAQKAAIELMATARGDADEVRHRLSKLGPCESLGAETARERCLQAAADHRAAREAVENRRAADAVRILHTAKDAIELAERAEARFLERKPQPPALVSRTPNRELVSTRKHSQLTFAVQAHDPNGDPLRYAWSFDGKPIEGARGDQIEVVASRGGRVSVSVDDGRGGRLTESWRIEIENRPPQLAVTPKEDVTLQPGERRSFQLSASDPDGDPIQELQTRLDGKVVATGARYEFTAPKPGRYALEFSARDAGGARSTLTKRITVEAKALPPVTTGRKEADGERNPVRAGDETWKAGVQAALDRYKACLERKDLPCVKESVWPQLSKSNMFWQAYEPKLERADTVQIDIDVLKWTHRVTSQGETVVTEIDQTDSFPPGPSRKRRWRSVLLKRGTTNDWQFIEHKIEG